MIIEDNVHIKRAIDDLREVVLNPGTFLYTAFSEPIVDDYFYVMEIGRVALFSGWAKSFRNLTQNSIRSIKNIDELSSLWDHKKIFPFSSDTVYTAPTAQVKKNERYLIYSAGAELQAAINSILNGGGQIVGVVDSNPKIWNEVRCNYLVENPEHILSHSERFDNVMIASGKYYHEIKKLLLNKGISEDKMSWV